MFNIFLCFMSKATVFYVESHLLAGFMPQSIRQKSGFSADGQAMFGHQVGVWHHVGARIVVVWHCMGV